MPDETHPLDAPDVSWEDDLSKNEEGGNEESNSISWIKFDHQGKYTVRPVGKAVKFLRWWAPFEAKDRVITHGSFKDEDKAWQAGFYPRKTFAIHVIDRADGQLKILEKGASIFGVFAAYKETNGRAVGAKVAPDWQITLVWPGGNKRQAQYTVVQAGDSKELTPEEQQMCKAKMINLKSLYRATPLEKINELFDAMPDSKKVPPKKGDDDIPVVDSSNDEQDEGNELFADDDDQATEEIPF